MPPKTKPAPVRTYEVTELVGHATGYVIEDGKRIDKFTIQSPISFDGDGIRAWLDTLTSDEIAAAYAARQQVG